MEMMYDSGSSITLARKDMMSPQMNNVAQFPLPVMKLVTATVNDLLMTDYIQTTVQIQYHTVNHMFEVVNTLITPAILGMDFLQQHGLSNRNNTDPILRPILQAECNLWTKHCAIVSFAESKEDKVFKTTLFHYFHRLHLWNFYNIGWVTYRQLFVNFRDSSKHVLKKQILLTTTFQL